MATPCMVHRWPNRPVVFAVDFRQRWEGVNSHQQLLEKDDLSQITLRGQLSAGSERVEPGVGNFCRENNFWGEDNF